MKIFESSCITIEFDENTKILTQTWKGYATSAQFREGIEKSINLFKQKGAKAVLTDSLNGGIVRKEDTDWAATYAVPLLLQSGMKAQAFIVPTNAFIQMSVKNYTEQTGGTFQLQYFDDLEKGKNWLLAL
jgi:hypothetical protein